MSKNTINERYYLPPWTADALSGFTKTSTSESRVDITSVLPTSEDLVSLKNSITGRGEGWSTWLQLHSVENKLNEERVSVLWNKWLGQVTLSIVLGNVTVVVVGVGDVGWWEQGVREAVLLNESLGDLEEETKSEMAVGYDRRCEVLTTKSI